MFDMTDAADDRMGSMVYPYVVGGSLPWNAKSYVVRQADAAFYRALKAGQFCYVLNARQMGKSSLRVQTMARLQGEGDVCVFIDMSDVGGGKSATEDFWYFSLLWQIVKQVGDQSIGLEGWTREALRSWWRESEGLTFVLRWREFIEEELLGKIDRSIAIFVDEIDSTLALAFSVDDFFAVIRSCYQRRVEDVKFERLTFALLGVCTPQDLMQDKQRTPFNIGQAIELTGFTFEEAVGLAVGLPGGVVMLRAILDWTGGQPFLMQRLCRLVREAKADVGVDEVVMRSVIEGWEGKDESIHFSSIQERIMGNENIATALLGMYQTILKDGGMAIKASDEQLTLRLAGIVVKRGDRVQVANRIYEQVFGEVWVTKKLAELRPYFYADALQKWSESEDKALLLQGELLAIARNWASVPTRKLAPEDYRFINASYELQSNFKFKNGNASNVKELLDLCESYPKEAQTYLINGYLERWLVVKLGNPSLAAAASSCAKNYKKDFEKALEMFIRFLYSHLGEDGNPLIILEPSSFDIGQIPIGSSREIRIKSRILNRGLAWGETSYKRETDGIKIKNQEFDSRKTNDIIVNIDLPQDFEIIGKGLRLFIGSLQIEGIPIIHEFRIVYQVIPVPIKITPSSLNLDWVNRFGRVREGTITLDFHHDANLRVQGYVTSSNPSSLMVYPSRFNTPTSIKYRITPDQSISGLIEESIIIYINNFKTIIPVAFKVSIDYKYIFLKSFPVCSILAVVSGVIRSLIERSQSSPDYYLLLGILSTIGFFPTLTIFLNFFKADLKRSGLMEDLTFRTAISLIFGIPLCWLLNFLGILYPIGQIASIIPNIIDILSSVFGIFTIDSLSWRWALLSYFVTATTVFLIPLLKKKIRKWAKNAFPS